MPLTWNSTWAVCPGIFRVAPSWPTDMRKSSSMGLVCDLDPNTIQSNIAADKYTSVIWKSQKMSEWRWWLKPWSHYTGRPHDNLFLWLLAKLQAFQLCGGGIWEPCFASCGHITGDCCAVSPCRHRSHAPVCLAWCRGNPAILDNLSVSSGYTVPETI